MIVDFSSYFERISFKYWYMCPIRACQLLVGFLDSVAVVEPCLIRKYLSNLQVGICD
jgi:hypothetical protein